MASMNWGAAKWDQAMDEAVGRENEDTGMRLRVLGPQLEYDPFGMLTCHLVWAANRGLWTWPVWDDERGGWVDC